MLWVTLLLNYLGYIVLHYLSTVYRHLVELLVCHTFSNVECRSKL